MGEDWFKCNIELALCSFKSHSETFVAVECAVEVEDGEVSRLRIWPNLPEGRFEVKFREYSCPTQFLSRDWKVS